MMCILEKHVTRAISHSGSISPSEIVQNLRSNYLSFLLSFSHHIHLSISLSKQFISAEIAPGFRPGRQEDAHEFLRFVVENAQKSCLGHLQKDK